MAREGRHDVRSPTMCIPDPCDSPPCRPDQDCVRREPARPGSEPGAPSPWDEVVERSGHARAFSSLCRHDEWSPGARPPKRSSDRSNGPMTSSPDREQSRKRLDLLANGVINGYHFTSTLTTPSGSPLQLEVDVQRLNDAEGRDLALVLLAPGDATHEAERADALVALRCHLPRTAELDAPLLVGTVDRDWRIERLSSDVKDVLGYDPNAIIGTPVHPLGTSRRCGQSAHRDRPGPRGRRNGDGSRPRPARRQELVPDGGGDHSAHRVRARARVRLHRPAGRRGRHQRAGGKREQFGPHRCPGAPAPAHRHRAGGRGHRATSASPPRPRPASPKSTNSPPASSRCSPGYSTASGSRRSQPRCSCRRAPYATTWRPSTGSSAFIRKPNSWRTCVGHP